MSWKGLGNALRIAGMMLAFGAFWGTTMAVSAALLASQCEAGRGKPVADPRQILGAGMLIGAALSFLCLPIPLITLRRKDLRIAARRLLLLVTPMCIALSAGLLIRSPLMLAAPFLAALGLAIVCVELRIRLPNRELEVRYPDCPGCGYDLRACVAHRCPECASADYIPDDATRSTLNRLLEAGCEIRITSYANGRCVIATRRDIHWSRASGPGVGGALAALLASEQALRNSAGEG